MNLSESDVPKILRTESGRFLTGPGWPILEIAEVNQVGTQLHFTVLHHTPLPILRQTVGVRFLTPAGELSESASDNILAFGRDEWSVEIPAGALSASIRVAIAPFEVAIDRKEIPL